MSRKGWYCEWADVEYIVLHSLQRTDRSCFGLCFPTISSEVVWRGHKGEKRRETILQYFLNVVYITEKTFGYVKTNLLSSKMDLGSSAPSALTQLPKVSFTSFELCLSICPQRSFCGMQISRMMTTCGSS